MSNAFNLSQLANNVNTSGLLQVAGGGTGVTSSTGSGSVVLSAGATLTNATITTATTGLTFSDASTQTAAASPYVLKNRIINGAMVIDQRNAGASVTPTNGQYTLDRYNVFTSQSSKFTVQQNAGSVTPPVGFTNYLGVTSSSAYTVLTGDYFSINQKIEGFNTADLAWGTANAKTVTLSFQVRSSLTGTFGGAITNDVTDRSYPFSYSIPVANTWTTISITIAGDTTGTWNTNSSAGPSVRFGLGAGTTYSGTAGSWAAANYVSATSAVSVVGTNGATFYITGVQLEVGSTATPFERRLYNQELANCQRYCYVLGPDNSEYAGYAYGTNASVITIPFPVTVRAAPTGITTSGQWIGFNSSNTSSNATLNFNVSGYTSCSVTAGFTCTAGTPSRINSNAVAKVIFNGMEL